MPRSTSFGGGGWFSIVFFTDNISTNSFRKKKFVLSCVSFIRVNNFVVACRLRTDEARRRSSPQTRPSLANGLGTPTWAIPSCQFQTDLSSEPGASFSSPGYPQWEGPGDRARSFRWRNRLMRPWPVNIWVKRYVIEPCGLFTYHTSASGRISVWVLARPHSSGTSVARIRCDHLVAMHRWTGFFACYSPRRTHGVIDFASLRGQ